jgi:hypothetical protein
MLLQQPVGASFSLFVHTKEIKLTLLHQPLMKSSLRQAPVIALLLVTVNQAIFFTLLSPILAMDLVLLELQVHPFRSEL